MEKKQTKIDQKQQKKLKTGIAGLPKQTTIELLFKTVFVSRNSGPATGDYVILY